MLIDWFTVIAQLVNFLLLVWLLKRFLYQPILSTIDAREKRIADELADADAKRTQAEQQGELYRHKNQVFDQQRMEKMNKVSAESSAEKARLLAAVREEANALRTKLMQALQDEQRSLQVTLRDRAQQEIFEIARKTLKDLADAPLETSMVAVFIRRLRELTGPEKAPFQAGFKDIESPVIVRSAFDLSEQQRGLISEAITALINPSVKIQFETTPELISGIEMNANGQKVAWSIADYLTTLTQRVNQVMQSRDEQNTEQGSHDKHL
ncbi:F0F1 ATP synthase subunit delta [Idiomarina abyssalis]|uniref:F0F1 ATP synthase subunit delta n=1 Tax=Idiomarina abyssalis TaxID=86102 RepID=UPI003A8FEDAD